MAFDQAGPLSPVIALARARRLPIPVRHAILVSATTAHFMHQTNSRGSIRFRPTGRRATERGEPPLAGSARPFPLHMMVKSYRNHRISHREIGFYVRRLVPLSTHPAAALPAIGTPDVVNAWLRARNPNTLRGYLSDLNTFREWLGASSTAAAVEALLSAGQAGANLMTMNYAAALVERGLAGATIARRLAALRSMCKVSRKIGRTNWSLDVEGPRVEATRDMRGPDLLDVRLLWRAAIGAGDEPRARRDRADSRVFIRSRVASCRAMQPRSSGRRGRPGGNPACGVGAPSRDLDSGERPDRERTHDPTRSDRRRPGRVDRGPRRRTRPVLPSPRRPPSRTRMSDSPGNRSAGSFAVWARPPACPATFAPMA